jgi:hypothetical protein
MNIFIKNYNACIISFFKCAFFSIFIIQAGVSDAIRAYLGPHYSCDQAVLCGP